jgi:signal transduction histidine kinase
MDELAVNRWGGKSADEILAELLHQLRTPLHAAVGSLSVLKSADQLSPEQTQQMIDMALRSALYARDIINSLSQHMYGSQKDQ